jgi:TetR/AcrR family tetracycline transcriptional repressor
MGRRLAPGLDRARLVAAAFAVLEADGLDGMSMRRVAAELGVQAPALYWHIGDKAELLGLMARDIYAAAYAAAPGAGDWRVWLAAFGHALRTSFARHRDGARLCAMAKPSSDPETSADAMAAPLAALGLDPHTAIAFQAGVISYTLGWAMFEANGPMHAFLERMLSFDESFALGLEALVTGFRAE